MMARPSWGPGAATATKSSQGRLLLGRPVSPKLQLASEAWQSAPLYPSHWGADCRARVSARLRAPAPLEAIVQLADRGGETVAVVMNVLTQRTLHSVQPFQQLARLTTLALDARELLLQHLPQIGEARRLGFVGQLSLGGQLARMAPAFQQHARLQPQQQQDEQHNQDRAKAQYHQTQWPLHLRHEQINRRGCAQSGPVEEGEYQGQQHHDGDQDDLSAHGGSP